MKYFKFGVEFKLFTLDSNGYMTDGAPRLIEHLRKVAPHVRLTPEAGTNMLELETTPHVRIRHFMTQLMQDFETLLYHAESLGLILYPFGTYPGRFTPEFNPDPTFQIQEKLFGKERWRIAGRCVGMHCHYNLPWSLFDTDVSAIKNHTHSRNKQSLVDVYNLFIAMDPALTTFAQSSPFYQGEYLGKDSRVIIYRGGEILRYPRGLYTHFQKFGSLQQYETTGSDLAHIIKRRFTQWGELISAAKDGSTPAPEAVLDATWNPVKITAGGMLEQRGMDMNMPNVVCAVALIIKYLGRQIQQKHIQVIPSDTGILEPFRLQGNEIFIPPHTHVRHVLQPQAAYEGLDNPDVHLYCSSLLRLAERFIPSQQHALLSPLWQMLEVRRTTSDAILSRAEQMGIDTTTVLSNADAARLAKKLAEGLYKNIILTRQALENVGE